MFFSQTVRRDDEDDKSDVIGRELDAVHSISALGGLQKGLKMTIRSAGWDPSRLIAPQTSKTISS